MPQSRRLCNLIGIGQGYRLQECTKYECLFFVNFKDIFVDRWYRVHHYEVGQATVWNCISVVVLLTLARAFRSLKCASSAKIARVQSQSSNAMDRLVINGDLGETSLTFPEDKESHNIEAE